MRNSRPENSTFINAIREHVSYEESMAEYVEKSLVESEWGVSIVYTNDHLKKQLVFQNKPFYTDYGFTVEILEESRQNQVLVLIPHEFQDKECFFVKYSLMMMFSDSEISKRISSEYTKSIDHVPYRIDEDRYCKVIEWYKKD